MKNIPYLIKAKFSESGIDIRSIEKRDYPGETIFVIQVAEDNFDSAAKRPSRAFTVFNTVTVSSFASIFSLGCKQLSQLPQFSF